MNEKNSYPLSWPAGWKRTPAPRGTPRFYVKSIEKHVQEILTEFRRMGVADHQLVISSNLELRNDGYPKSGQKNPADPGVAIYFKLNGQDRVLACDKWHFVEQNLSAIARHVESVRAQDRWGVGNIAQAFAGYTALMSGREVRDWWVVLGFDHPTEDAVAVLLRRNILAKQYHPDNGGSAEKMAEINEAVATFKKEQGIP